MRKQVSLRDRPGRDSCYAKRCSVPDRAPRRAATTFAALACCANGSAIARRSPMWRSPSRGSASCRSRCSETCSSASATSKRFCAARCLPAFALSEPEAGPDVASIRTTAEPIGSGYCLQGCKTWTSNAGLADLYVVFAGIGDEAGARGISAFLVDGRHPGVALEERLRVLPPHTVGTLRFDDCVVEASSLLGAPGDGFRIAMTVFELFRPTVAAATLGFARCAMDEALERSTERVAFRKPIAEHQLIQQKLADMAVKIDATALLTYRAAWTFDATDAPIGREASIAKLFSTEMAQEVVDQALQVFGGQGVVQGAVVERLSCPCVSHLRWHERDPEAHHRKAHTPWRRLKPPRRVRNR